MFVITLICIATPFLAVFYYHIRKCKKLGWFARLTTVIAIAVSIISMFYPIEDVFLRFPTKEQAFHYTRPFQKITNVYVSDTDEVCVMKSGSKIVPLEKDKKGWKREGYKTLIKTNSFLINTSESVYSVFALPINKKWLFIEMDLDIGPKANHISDSLENQFEYKEENGRYSYFAFVKNIPEDYMLKIDDQDVTFEKTHTYMILAIGFIVISSWVWICMWVCIYIVTSLIIKKRRQKYNINS